MHHHEMALVAAFIKRNKRDRYREFLSVPRLRHRFICELSHFKDFDPKYRVAIRSNRQSATNVSIELKKRRSPDIVYAISEFGALDQKEMLLTEALQEILGRGMGTILCCIPGILAFVETEDQRFILERPHVLKRTSTCGSLLVPRTRTPRSG
jgi:hypothetical protein